ncbi:type II secretion system protein GspL [Salinicola sp. DM10]|uniref:type II secretion system protein GspL n=1 Tax=Salinicola sp. DM10 TaxID=2815721 RepID=UPI001A8F9CDA|nr:type II secretion system protein GspL [Salinicola sp. DM10]MCE3026810.1 type II secretion system protein GspL [Salinicola sp. DM10]
MRRSARPARAATRLLVAPRQRLAPLIDASADTETDADTRLRVDWCLEGATPHTLSDTSPPEAWQALTRLAASHPVTLLLAADAVSHFHLAAPRGLKRREWPLLLETVTSEAVDQLHLNPLQRGRGHLELIALPRAELAAWRAWARRLGLAPTGWSCAFLALPRPATPDQITTLDDGSHRLCLGLAAPVAPGAPEARQWLAWPRDWPLPPAWRERDCQVVDGNIDTGPDTDAHGDTGQPRQHDGERGDGDGDGERDDDERQDGGEAAAAQARLRSLTWLADQPPAALPFADDSGARRQGITWQPQRRTRWLAGAIALLALLDASLWLATSWREDAATSQRQAAALAARFVGPPPADARAALASRADAIDALAQRNRQLSEALATATAQLAATPWQLSRLAVSGNRATLAWRYPEPPAPVVLNRARQALATLGEAQWQALPGELSLNLPLAADTPEPKP